jgi:hypothetical protein
MLVADIYRIKDSYYDFYALRQAGDEEAKAQYDENMKKASVWVQKYAKLGKWKAHYPFADGRGGISIWEFESGEEMARILSDSILWPYIESETILLSETDMIANYLKELAKAEKKTVKK